MNLWIWILWIMNLNFINYEFEFYYMNKFFNNKNEFFWIFEFMNFISIIQPQNNLSLLQSK